CRLAAGGPAGGRDACCHLAVAQRLGATACACLVACPSPAGWKSGLPDDGPIRHTPAHPGRRRYCCRTPLLQRQRGVLARLSSGAATAGGSRGCAACATASTGSCADLLRRRRTSSARLALSHSCCGPRTL